METANSTSLDGSKFGNFPQFIDLPPEIRDRIWNFALGNLHGNHTIQLAIYSLVHVVAHRCDVDNARFCGNHSICRTSNPDGEPGQMTVCMADAYFATSDEFPEPADNGSCLASNTVGLACQESRSLFLARYSRQIRVYRGQWRPGVEYRVVRFGPADLPIVTSITESCCEHPDESMPGFIHALNRQMMSQFPQNVTNFAAFREAISSWPCIGLRYLGRREPGFEVYLQNDESEKLRKFLLFCESLEHLVMWPDPGCWPEIQNDAIRVDNIEDLKTDDNDVRSLIDDAKDTRRRHDIYTKVQSDRMTNGDGHWVPKPKPFTQIGCYAASSWL